MTLNLKSDEGRAIFLKLAETADVVIENYRSDVKHRLGIDYEAVSKVNPRIVYGSISGFGQDGPDATRPGVDQIAQGMGGLMSITGEPGRGPMRVGIPIADLTAGLFLSQAMPAGADAARRRPAPGNGCRRRCLRRDLHARFPGGALAASQGDVAKQAGNDHPDRDSDRRVSDRRRPHQHRGVGRCAVDAVLRDDRRDRIAVAPGPCHRRVALAQPQGAERADRPRHQDEAERALGEADERRRRTLRPDQFHRPDICRAAGAASRHRQARASPGARRHQGGRSADQSHQGAAA